MKICKLAVDTCYWPMFEVIEGQWRLTHKPGIKLPIEDFLKPHGRFKHLFSKENEHLIHTIQQDIDQKWNTLLRRCED